MSYSIRQARTMRVAAVQVESQPGQLAANHAHALPYIEEAAAQGAQLVVLPELFACGYIANQAIWRYGEPLQGPTVRWLRDTARRLDIYLGAGFAEVEGSEFFNAFALADPAGRLAGCARKHWAETYCFRGGAGQHLVGTELASLGIGICADNHMTSFFLEMQQNRIEALLMPHASPMPYRTSATISEADIAQLREKTVSLVTRYASLLGTPAIFVNAVGDLQPMAGLLGRFITPEHFRLRGFSRIADSDGTLVGELGEEEGVLVADVTLDPVRRRSDGEPEDYDGWLHPGSTIMRKMIMPIDGVMGRLSYGLSQERRRLAQRAVTESASTLDSDQ